MSTQNFTALPLANHLQKNFAQRMKPKAFWKFCAVSARILLGLIFFTAGMSKLMDFPGVIGPVWLEEALEPHGLGLYARFIAWSQILIGLLLLTQRFATIGAIMVFPLIINILMVTVSMGWRGTPYVILVLLFMNLYLLIYDWHRLKVLIMPASHEVRSIQYKRPSVKGDLVWFAGMVCIVFGVLAFSMSAALSWTILATAGALFIIALFMNKST